MRTTPPLRLVGFKDVELSADGKFMNVVFLTEPGEGVDLTIPLDALGDVVHFLTVAAARLTEDAAAAGVAITPAPFTPEPIPVRKMAMAPGAGPGETLLTVQTAGYGLTFAIPAPAKAAAPARLPDAA
ncbi:MAG: hypothetical protein ACK41C_09230 [Phenylobacterium sp.]|uniref:hypothetical protein n=1 Tax=Phenylobacterium sp. TaxID=1871053 RepID=UPI00391935BB